MKLNYISPIVKVITLPVEEVILNGSNNTGQGIGTQDKDNTDKPDVDETIPGVDGPIINLGKSSISYWGED